MSKWISIKERLPEKSGEYLIYCEGGYIGLTNYSAKHKLFNCWDSFEEGIDSLEYAFTTVTYWQPVPEPPKKCNL